MTTPYFQDTMYSVKFETTPDIDINMYDDSDVYKGDIELDLANLHNFDNTKQLEILRYEIGHIVSHNITPSDGWFDERFKHIIIYSNLGWTDMMRRFKNKDPYIYENVTNIMILLEELLEQRATKPNFNIFTYHKLLYSIQNIWNYYSQIYMGNETDVDMLDIIEAMTFL